MAITQNVETEEALGAGETVSGVSRDCLNFAQFNVSACINVAGKIGKVEIAIENSHDESAWRSVRKFLVKMSRVGEPAFFNESFPIARRHYRVKIKEIASVDLDTTELISVQVP